MVARLDKFAYAIDQPRVAAKQERIAVSPRLTNPGSCFFERSRVAHIPLASLCLSRLPRPSLVTGGGDGDSGTEEKRGVSDAGPVQYPLECVKADTDRVLAANS